MLSKNVICSIVANVIVKVTLYISGCFTQLSVMLKSVYKCDRLQVSSSREENNHFETWRNPGLKIELQDDKHQRLISTNNFTMISVFGLFLLSQ